MSVRYPEKWNDTNRRNGIIDKVCSEYSQNYSDVVIKQMTMNEFRDVMDISCQASQNTPFFATSVGLTVNKMPAYWRSINLALLSDPNAIMLGAYKNNQIMAVVSCATGNFPNLKNTIALLWNLLTGIGLGSTISFLKAIGNFEKVFPEKQDFETSIMLRGIWFYNRPGKEGVGYGRVLIKIFDLLIPELGFKYIQLACDGESSKLIRYYERIGGKLEREIALGGFKTAVILIQY
jgi:hypothetical protein